jgi:nucleoid-associated protein YgaU
MSIKLDCPVCGYKEIEKDICPNCDTDLVQIRMLQGLPKLEEPQQKLHSPPKIATWQLAVAAIILLIGMGLGTLGSFLFFQPQQIAAITPNNPVVITSPSPIPAPAKPQEPTTYTVKLGDNLSLITETLCQKGTDWQVMVQANPQLKGRENYIDKGEVLKIPNCKEAI